MFKFMALHRFNLRLTNAVILFTLTLSVALSGCATTKSTQKTKKVANNSAEVVKVYFAGFAMTGDSAASATNFPFTTELLEEKKDKGISSLDQEAQGRIKGVNNPRLQIVTNELGDYRKGDGIVAAVVIDAEDVSEEKIEGKTKIDAALRGQLIAFNFKEMKVVGSYPLTAVGLDLVDGVPTPERKKSLIRELYSGKRNSLIAELVSRLNSININTSYTHGIQIKSVNINDDAFKIIKKGDQEKRDVAMLLARTFEKYLSANQNVSVLPYTKDQAIGGRMPTRFSNGDVYNLVIPDADYTVTLSLNKFKKAEVGESSVERVYGYASFMNIKVEQPEMMKMYVDINVRNVAARKVPKHIQTMDDRASYMESMLKLNDVFTKQITDQNSDWMETWTESKKDVRSQLEDLSEVVYKCR